MLREILGVIPAAAAQRPGGMLIGTWRPAKSESDASRIQGFKRSELLREHERRMIRKHDPA